MVSSAPSLPSAHHLAYWPYHAHGYRACLHTDPTPEFEVILHGASSGRQPIYNNRASVLEFIDFVRIEFEWLFQQLFHRRFCILQPLTEGIDDLIELNHFALHLIIKLRLIFFELLLGLPGETAVCRDRVVRDKQ